MKMNCSIYTNKSINIPFASGVVFLLFAILCEIAAIMILNHGVFTYTLDDPYIHMALAENILHGHY